MKYRQWKKNYKKRYGINPPLEIDRRKRRKQEARAFTALANGDFKKVIIRAAEYIAETFGNVMRSMGNTCDAAGSVFRNAGNIIQPLEIRGRIKSWEVKGENNYYTVYENDRIEKREHIIVETYSRSAAEKIAEILEKDQMEYIRRTSPERVCVNRSLPEAFENTLAEMEA